MKLFAALVALLVLVEDAAASSLQAPAPRVDPSAVSEATMWKRLPRGGQIDVQTKMFRRIHESDQMPCLFGPEEVDFDRYAACLAATEGLRRIRDTQLADEQSKNPEAERHITAQYVQNSGKMLKSLGMSVPRFNELGRRISKDEALKEKVRTKAGCWIVGRSLTR